MMVVYTDNLTGHKIIELHVKDLVNLLSGKDSATGLEVADGQLDIRINGLDDEIYEAVLDGLSKRGDHSSNVLVKKVLSNAMEVLKEAWK